MAKFLARRLPAAAAETAHIPDQLLSPVLLCLFHPLEQYGSFAQLATRSSEPVEDSPRKIYPMSAV